MTITTPVRKTPFRKWTDKEKSCCIGDSEPTSVNIAGVETRLYVGYHAAKRYAERDYCPLAYAMMLLQRQTKSRLEKHPLVQEHLSRAQDGEEFAIVLKEKEVYALKFFMDHGKPALFLRTFYLIGRDGSKFFAYSDTTCVYSTQDVLIEGMENIACIEMNRKCRRARCKIQNSSAPFSASQIRQLNTKNAQNVENFCILGALLQASVVNPAPNVENFQFFLDYAVFSVERCVCSRPASRFFQSFFRLKPRARIKSSVRTFFLPLVRNRRNPKSFFRSPKAPST